MQEKETLLVTSNFSFFHNVFNLYGTYFYFKCTLKCYLQFVSIWTSLKTLSSGNGLNHVTSMAASGSSNGQSNCTEMEGICPLSILNRNPQSSAMADISLFLFKDIFVQLQFSTSLVQKPKCITSTVYLTA